ncbi:uncharacterized protein LOC131679762 [Topomyia yanbarensis]|uniref:uncharacterized protein LOC131679762 n=1 Tax=Topomyia yanbarensis TaxID=2498891 RepID=UPI00273A848E|nr:uncharacterized protein LOC131679762 [Topomyia yanbarensis]
MKGLLVIFGLCLALCEGRIDTYRRPVQNREPHQGVFGEDYNDADSEDTYEDALSDRSYRVNEYEPTYGYAKNHKRRLDSESEYEQRQPKYISGRSRGKYSSFGSSPQHNYGRDPISKKHSYGPEIRDRKKDYRSIPGYESPYQPYSPPGYSHPPPPPPPSYKPVVPKQNCQQNLLIGCSPTVTRVPCGGHESSYHSVGSALPQPPYHSPTAAMPPPQPTAVYHHPKPAVTYQPHTPAAAHHHTHIPSNRQSSQPSVPSFSPPVKEDIQEISQRPFISAFPTTTTSAPQLPTVAADRDQHFRFAERTTNPPLPSSTVIENIPSPKEASGDEPEPSATPRAASAPQPPPALIPEPALVPEPVPASEPASVPEPAPTPTPSPSPAPATLAVDDFFDDIQD